MNRFFGALFSLAAATLVCSCGGNPGSASYLAGTATTDTSSSGTVRTLKAAEGFLAGVKVKAGPAGSFATYAEVNYTVACYEHVDSVTSAVRERDGRFTVYFSGVVSEFGSSEAMRCVGLSMRTHEVALSGGIIGAGAVKVVNMVLTTSSTEVANKDLVVKPLDGGRVTGTQPLCPADSGIECVLNGTSVTVSFDRRCSEQEGPMGYAIEQLPGKRVRLAVVAYALAKGDSAAAPFCQSFETQTLTVTLLNTFVEDKDIEIVTLHQ